jgi:hypothetical protein
MSSADCSAQANSLGITVAAAVAEGACSIRLTTSVSASPSAVSLKSGISTGVSPMSMTSGCTQQYYYPGLQGQIREESFPWGLAWSETSFANFDLDNCNNIRWNYKWYTSDGHGYSVNNYFDDVYPALAVWNQNTSTWKGSYYTVSAFVNGFPISSSHGSRWSFDVHSWGYVNLQTW